MSSPHQQWLEAPYEKQAEKELQFEKYCEERNLDSDDEGVIAEFEDWLDNQWYEADPDDAYEAAQEREWDKDR
jgi:hypothetical protein